MAGTYYKNGALIEGLVTTATAAGTTTLTASSQTNQQFTGVTTQTVVLPDATTLSVGRCFRIFNRSSGLITVKYADGSTTLTTVPAGAGIEIRVVTNGTTNGTYDVNSGGASVAASAVTVTPSGNLSSTDTQAALLELQGDIDSLSAGTVTPTGVGMEYWGTSAPTGWVMASGRTIGSVASSSTERANADTLNLYTLLWNSTANTELIIQDSAGTPTTRGVSAAADFAANKRLPLPDKRGRVTVGKDDMGGSAASRMTSGGAGLDGTVLAKAGGSQTHVLDATEMPAHDHGAATGTESANHTHNTPTRTFSGNSNIPAGSSTNEIIATNQAGSSATSETSGTQSANHTHAISSAGGGAAHTVTQPSIVANHIIKL